MLRAVVDPNVLIAAAINRAGTPGQVLAAAARERYTLLVSPHLLEELTEVLHRPALRRWLTLEEVQRFIREVDDMAELIADAPQPWAPATRDPKDDYLVALARASSADVLVSRDHDLTALVSAVPPVLTPAAFLRRLGAE